MYKLESFNLELTTKCPLRCPQCYCTLEGGKDLPKETAIRMIREAAELGAEHVELSGGETLCYPYLTELVREAKENGISSNIAISGWHFDKKKAEELTEAGIGGIFVSINAPTPEQNALTRDGFEYAMQALEVLADAGFGNTYINWVMHRDTADTLPDMIRLVEPYHPKGIVILMPKPDAMHTLNSFPTTEQMETVKQLIKHNESHTGIYVESCFSPLLALIGRNLWGNRNTGTGKGCGAGICSLSVSVDGTFSPCRHLDYYEPFDSMKDYWNRSETLAHIRALKEEEKQAPCSRCEFQAYCRPCLAVNAKLKNQLSLGNEKCLLYEKYPKEKGADDQHE